MTSSLPPKAHVAILQTEHTSKITSEDRVSQSAGSGEWCRPQPPGLMIHWDSSASPFPFKSCRDWAETLELVLGHESIFSPEVQHFWLQRPSFLLTLCVIRPTYFLNQSDGIRWHFSIVWISLNSDEFEHFS